MLIGSRIITCHVTMEHTPSLPSGFNINGYLIQSLKQTDSLCHVYYASDADHVPYLLREFCPQGLAVRDPESGKLRYPENTDIEREVLPLKNDFEAQFRTGSLGEIPALGTVNLLECVRTAQTPPRSVLNVTTDKVYQNNEWCWGYRENEPLDGFDPYSNSKSCSELVTHSYKNSFFADGSVAISTARAGNVIGGGDFANDRIIPDCVRAMAKGESIGVRNPYSTRPYQHVLEPLAAYLLIAQRQYEDNRYAGYYNVGPDDCDCVTTGTLVDLFCQAWGDGAAWENRAEANAPHEANFLKLDCSKLKSTFGWKPRWHMAECMQKTVAFSKVWLSGGDIPAEMDKEIKEFLSE